MVEEILSPEGAAMDVDEPVGGYKGGNGRSVNVESVELGIVVGDGKGRGVEWL